VTLDHSNQYEPAAGEALVFSAHLDDGVLSASLRLARPSARLVTVFSAAPPDGLGVTEWDVLTRASSSAVRHRERLAEDAAAAAVLGCGTVYLDQPENSYRDGAPADLAAAAEAVAPLLPGAAEVWVPAGIGGHPDHRAAREAVLSAVRRLPAPPPVYLYADLPYTIRHGWPRWVSGEPGEAYLDPDIWLDLDPDAWLDLDLRERGLDPARLEPLVFHLTPAQQKLKAAAVACYPTQLAALEVVPDSGPRWTNLMSHEVVWREVSG
jgi:LmbE family N-acetylglucosaminyl deacetylase